MKENKAFHLSVAFKLIIIILAVSIIPILIVSISGMFSVQSVSDIATDTSKEIARSSVNDSATALESELTRAISLQTATLGREIDLNLHQISDDTTLLRDYAELLYNNPSNTGRYPFPSIYSRGSNQVFGSIKKNNNSWLMVSELGLNPDRTVPNTVLEEVYITEWLDVLFRSIALTNPNAVQLYINTKSHFSRGMPFENGTYNWIDATVQFAPDMNLSSYDFYYLADKEHDPLRKTVWTKLYYDPAGLGWMISSVSPVYVKDELKAVVGIDITLSRIINSILNVKIEKTGFAFLIAENGELIAFPERAGPFLGFQGNLSGEFRRDEQLRYNLLDSSSKDLQKIASDMISGKEGIVRYRNPTDNNEYFVAFTPIKETGWSVGVVSQVSEVTEPSRRISTQINSSIDIASERISNQINTLILNNLLIIILILIAMIPTAFILTRMISKPIKTLIDGSQMIGAGDLSHRIIISTDDELEELANTFNKMASDLDQKMSEIEKVNLELRRMDELKSKFISIASHELRTPLIAIKGYIDLVLKSGKKLEFEEQKKMLESVARNTQRLGRIINELLDMSQIEADSLVVAKGFFSLPDLIHEIAEEQKSSIDKRGHTLVIDLESELPLMYGDKDRIAQLIINLLGNAIKYTPDKGTITIRGFYESDSIHFIVQDTGIGIKEENLPHIFTRFYQASEVTSHRTGKDEFLAGGTGLGLAIVKGIVEAHNGEIYAESSFGRGTIFHVIFPIDEEENKVKGLQIQKSSTPANSVIFYKPAKSLHSHTGEKKIILIVDDEPDTLEFLTDLLQPGYHVITANSGATGLKSAINNIPDLILLDAWMPGISGLDVCTTLKKNQKTLHIPIIMVTAAVGESQKREIEKCGADAFLGKPFEIQDLFLLIHEFISEEKEDSGL